MKSKYPNKIDTSLEIPIVRDNITQITSELFNSLRSAVIKIEKTLGITPNGAESIDVAERLNKSLDELGNIKKSAISALNLLQGPITNSDVADGANIDEGKLNLNYSTTALYGRTEGIKKDLENIIKTVNDFSVKLSIHLDKNTSNQHNAKQITVEDNNSSPTGSATISLSQKNLQDVIQDLYNNHINLIDTDITSTNRSHSAGQIYFDNSGLSLTSTNVQGAIEEVSGDFGEVLNDKFELLHSNGLIKFGKTSSPYTSEQYDVSVDSSSIIFSLNSSNTTKFEYVVSQTVLIEIEQFDVLELFNTSGSYKKYFKISEFTLDSSGKIADVTIFGSPKAKDDDTFFIRVLKNNYKYFNRSGLITLAKPSYKSIREPYILSQHPNSATVVSKRLNIGKINSSTCNITVETELGSNTMNIYDSSISEQTLESVCYKINNYATENNLPILAAILNENNFEEISISHAMPNNSLDSKKRYIKIKTSSSNDASTALGFSDIIDEEVIGYGKNSTLQNGGILNDSIEVLSFSGTEIEQNIGLNSINSIGKDFLLLGIKKGDLIYLDTGTASDNGLFVISDVTSAKITFDNSDFVFSNSSLIANKYFVIKSGISLSDIIPENVTGLNIFFMLDLFLYKNELNYKKRLEYSTVNTNSGFNFIITDVSRNFITKNQTSKITINSSKDIIFTDPSGVSLTTSIKSDGYLKVFSADTLSFIEIFVTGYNSTISTNITCNIFGYENSVEEILSTSRATYSYNSGFILGEDSGKGIPKIIDKRNFGTIKDKNISTQFFEKIIEGPRNELRSNGFISGCKISNFSIVGTSLTFDVSSGVHYSNGIRREFSGVKEFKYNILSSGYLVLWIYFNKHGHIEVHEESTFSFIKYNEKNFLGVYDNFTSNKGFYDLRFFINKSDKKFSRRLNIGASEDSSHFRTIEEALAYIKYFRLLGEDAGFEIFISGEITITSPVKFGPSMSNIKIIGAKNLAKVKINIPGQASIAANKGINTDTSCAFLIESVGISFENITFFESSSSNYTAGIVVSTFSSNNYATNINNCTFFGKTGLKFFPIVHQKVNSSFDIQTGFSYGGGLHITNNKFVKCGNEYGCIIIGDLTSSTATVRNIIISNNYFNDSSPNQLTTEVNYNILQITNDFTSSSSLFSSTMSQISITGNVYDT